jgi:hypothetical protein
VTPLVMLLIFGVLEFGLLFKDYLGLASGVRDGARQASALGTDVDTDYQVLQIALKRMPALNRNQILRIVVFKGTSANSTVPTACKTGSVTNSCNSYTNADLNRPQSNFDGTASSPDRFWMPSKRKDRLSDPPDYVGVWIKVRHEAVTGFLPLTKDLEEEVVMRIEPSRV